MAAVAAAEEDDATEVNLTSGGGREAVQWEQEGLPCSESELDPHALGRRLPSLDGAALLPWIDASRWGGENTTAQLEREAFEWFVLGVEKDERSHLTTRAPVLNRLSYTRGYTLHFPARLRGTPQRWRRDSLGEPVPPLLEESVAPEQWEDAVFIPMTSAVSEANAALRERRDLLQKCPYLPRTTHWPITVWRLRDRVASLFLRVLLTPLLLIPTLLACLFGFLVDLVTLRLFKFGHGTRRAMWAADQLAQHLQLDSDAIDDRIKATVEAVAATLSHLLATDVQVDVKRGQRLTAGTRGEYDPSITQAAPLTVYCLGVLLRPGRRRYFPSRVSSV
eukprot:m.45995 g.45995  ORF g.45995 m.45995 type:complete len:335 (+) comp8706_c0_seq1:175-1179(+)